MKAISIHPFYAMAIADGIKTVECRTWKTDYRGPLLICSTAKKYHGTIPGHALCVVTLKDVVPFELKHLQPAMMTKKDYQPGAFYAWILEDNRIIKPIPLKGKLSLWNYDGPIEYIPPELWALPDGAPEPESDSDWFTQNWNPLMT